jgi:hypothetical protein
MDEGINKDFPPSPQPSPLARERVTQSLLYKYALFGLAKY